jgi:N-methylhydantoinase A
VSLLVGTDIGGTFTDVVGYDAQRRRVVFGKDLTRYADLVDGVVHCLDQVGIGLNEIEVLKHGTTQVINTLLQRTGAKTALVTTKGFRDILEIGRAGRPLPFDLDYARRPPLVQRSLRFEIEERIDAAGQIITALDLSDLDKIADELAGLGIEAVAVSFLNSYKNPAHEILAARLLRDRLRGVYVTSGSELSREWFEFERTSTAVANAYVGPHAARYLDRFETRLQESRFTGRFLIMASNGGVLSPQRARQQPVALVESGPVGGCIGAATYSRALGLERLVAFDMGGTTAKAALVEQHSFAVQPTYYVGGYEYGFPLRAPVLDIAEVGTGGGSIAYLDEQARLHVGPRSAGSEPGPVCFVRGGSEPTVTDANLALNRIGSGAFLGGSLRLDRAAAVAALEDRISAPLGYRREPGTDQVASGIVSLANAQMATAIKEISIERGKDVREFELFAFGGGGPLHGASLARELGMTRMIVPPEPGNFSALGMLFADARIDEVQTIHADVDDAETEALWRRTAEMRTAACEALRIDFGTTEAVSSYDSELRYKGQRHSIRVQLAAGDRASRIREKFLAAYVRHYGHADPAAAIEFVAIRVMTLGVTARLDLADLHRAARSGTPAPAALRAVYFSGSRTRIPTPVYDRYTMPVGFEVEGPAVIEEFGATTVIGPRDRLQVGRLGELVITIGPG